MDFKEFEKMSATRTGGEIFMKVLGVIGGLILLFYIIFG